MDELVLKPLENWRSETNQRKEKRILTNYFRRVAVQGRFKTYESQ
jgi:hypothetical protein